jgi:hypothetical protein
MYASFGEFLASMTERELLAWCRIKARTANRPKLVSGRPAHRITP